MTLGLPFEDGTHILYVNGEYRDDSDIGKLMHDFNCTSAEEMNFDLMAERTRYLKENPKGVGSMCKAMEELRVESYAEGKAEGVEIGKMEQAKKTALKLSRKGNSVEEIADLLGYDVDTVSSWIAPKDMLSEMCKAMEELRVESRKEMAVEMAQSLYEQVYRLSRLQKQARSMWTL